MSFRKSNMVQIWQFQRKCYYKRLVNIILRYTVLRIMPKHFEFLPLTYAFWRHENSYTSLSKLPNLSPFLWKAIKPNLAKIFSSLVQIHWFELWDVGSDIKTPLQCLQCTALSHTTDQWPRTVLNDPWSYSTHAQWAGKWI